MTLIICISLEKFQSSSKLMRLLLTSSCFDIRCGLGEKEETIWK